MNAERVVFLHPSLGLSGATERLTRMALHLERRGTRVTVLAREGSRADLLREAGIAVEHFELPERPLEAPFPFARARRRVAALDPSLVVATNERLATLAAWIGRPYVLEVDSEPRRRLKVHRKRLVAAVLPCRTLVSGAVNKGGLPRSHLRVIEHGPRIGPPPQAFAHGRARVRVGCAGLLDDSHGTRVFLEAAALLARKGHAIDFSIFGEGPEEEALRRLARELGIAEHTTIAAPTTRETSELLAPLDVFVSCLMSGAPGWLSIEALALGLPSVFSTASGSFGRIHDDETGFLVERGDAPKLADAIERMIRNPNEARTMGRRAQKSLHAEEPFARFESALETLFRPVPRDHALGAG